MGGADPRRPYPACRAPVAGLDRAGGVGVDGRMGVDCDRDKRGRGGRAGTKRRPPSAAGPAGNVDPAGVLQREEVEADPAEVNLSAFETFFDERRPFFLEGGQLLSGFVNNYFYSRRIGAEPPGGADAHYVERPSTTTLLGAAKLTGRLASGTAVGVLAALTGAAEPATPGEAAELAALREELAPFIAGGGLKLKENATSVIAPDELRDPDYLFTDHRLVRLLAFNQLEDVPAGVEPIMDRYAVLQRAADRLTVGLFVEPLEDD